MRHEWMNARKIFCGLFVVMLVVGCFFLPSTSSRAISIKETSMKVKIDGRYNAEIEKIDTVNFNVLGKMDKTLELSTIRDPPFVPNVWASWDPSPSPSTTPTLVRTLAGDLYAAFDFAYGGTYYPSYTFSTDDGLTWGGGVGVNGLNDPSGNPHHPAMTMTTNGAIFIAHEDSEFSIFKGTPPYDSTSWQIITVPGSSWYAGCKWPSITSFGPDTVYLTTERFNTTDSHWELVYLYTPDGGASWQTCSITGGGIADLRHPSITMTGNKVYMGYQYGAGASFQVSVLWEVPGSNTWDEPDPATHPSGEYPSVAAKTVGPVDNVYVAYQVNVGATYDIGFGYSWDSGLTYTFSTKTLTGNEVYPSVATNGTTVHLVYIGSSHIYYRNSTNSGANFGSPMKVTDTSSPSAVEANHGVYVMESANKPYILWEDERTGTRTDVYFSKMGAVVQLLDHVDVTPPSASLPTGGQQQFTAQGYDQYGQPISGLVYSWTAEPASIGTVTSSGMFTAGSSPGPGWVNATTTYNSVTKTGNATVTVTIPPPALAYVWIDPKTLIIQVGNTKQFKAKAYDTNNQEIASGVTYTWSVSGGIGTVSPATGNTTTFTASNAGSGTVDISATYNTVTETNSSNVDVVSGPVEQIAYVTLSPTTWTLQVGQTKQFFAKAYNTTGGEMTSGVSYSWSVSGIIGTVSPSSGSNKTTFTATNVGSGSVDVIATYNSVDKSNSSSVTVTSTPAPVLSYVCITPNSTTVQVNTQRQFSASAYDTDGKQITSGVSFTWSVSGSIGTLSTTSGTTTTLTAGSSPCIGTVDVTAEFNGVTKTNTSTVNVTSGPPPQLDHVEVIPAEKTLRVGDAQQFAAKAYDQNNNVISQVTTFVWTVSPSTLGNINANGYFVASTVGSGKVYASATFEGVTKNGSAVITVQAKVERGSITGKVTEEGTDNPIEGATVEAECGGIINSTMTDPNGKYLLPNLPVGKHNVTVIMKGYATVTKTADVTSNQVTTLNFALKSTGKTDLLIWILAAVVAAIIVLLLLIWLLRRKKKTREERSARTFVSPLPPPAPPTPPPAVELEQPQPTTDELDKIKKLGELKAQGLITEEEFQVKKEEILRKV